MQSMGVSKFLRGPGDQIPIDLSMERIIALRAKRSSGVPIFQTCFEHPTVFKESHMDLIGLR